LGTAINGYRLNSDTLSVAEFITQAL